MKVDSVVVLHSITNDLLLSLSGRQRKKQRKRSAAKAPLPGPVPPRRPLQGFGVASSANPAPLPCKGAGQGLPLHPLLRQAQDRQWRRGRPMIVCCLLCFRYAEEENDGRRRAACDGSSF